MRVSNRVVVMDVEGICESWASFYQDLFTACPVDLGVQSDLLDHLSLSLSPDEAALCDGAALPNEAHDALPGMAKGKFPGSDGLPKEFYVAFWDLLGEDLVNVFNTSLETGKNRLSFYLPLLFKRFQSRRRRRFFQHQWGANGCIGKVVGDSFHLSFLWFRVCLPRSPLLAVLWSCSFA